MMAFLRSCSPPSIFLISPASTIPVNCSMAAESSAVISSPWLAQSTSTPRSSVLAVRAEISSTSSSTRRRRCRIFCASIWLLQKSGADARASICASSSRGRAASKITPEIGGALHEVLVPAGQLFKRESHECLQRTSTCSGQPRTVSRGEKQRDKRQRRTHVSEQITDSAIDRLHREHAHVAHENRALENIRLLQHPAIWI